MTISLTIDLTSASRAAVGGDKDVGTVKRVDLSDGGVRLIAVLPSLVDAERANLTAAMLLDQIDTLSGQAVVDRIKITGLRFTPEGIIPIRGFLSAHLHTIKHVSLKELITNGSSQSDIDAFDSLAKVFRSSRTLETLNLSDNNLQVSQCGSIWENWASHTKLRQLILDYVAMDDQSVEELAANFTFADSLEELYVVLTKNIGDRGLDAANEILKGCRRVSSLRWAVRDAPPSAKLPWHGLAQMAESWSSKSSQASKLVHLVMDGGTITQVEVNDMCTAFQCFPALKTVKLRSVGLLDEGAKRLSEALLVSKPPLESLDLSRNDIKSTGAVAIARISQVDNISKNLSVLTLDRNRIDMGGARTVLEAFGSKGDPKLDIKLDGNPLHYGKLAFNLACRKGQVENERNELLKEVERMRLEMFDISSENALSSTYDARILQEEISKLKEEKKTLLAAFSIVGAAGVIENQSRLMNRITNLEKRVFGSSSEYSGARRDSFERRRSSMSSLGSSPLGGRDAVRTASLQHQEEQLSPTPSLSGRSTVSSAPLTKSPTPASPRRTMRDNMRDLVSPLALNTRNSGAIGPWASSPNSKKGVSGGTTSLGNLYGFGSPVRCKDGDDASVKTNQSRMTTRSDPTATEKKQRSQRDLYFTPSAYH